MPMTATRISTRFTWPGATRRAGNSARDRGRRAHLIFPVVVQLDQRAFPRRLKPCQFTALVDAETQDESPGLPAAPFQSKCKLHHYCFSASFSHRGRTAYHQTNHVVTAEMVGLG